MALHDVGPRAEGVAFSGENSNIGAAVVDGIVQADVLHRVLYPQVHVNGFKKKKKKTRFRDVWGVMQHAARALYQAVESVGQSRTVGDQTVEKQMVRWQVTRSVREK